MASLLFAALFLLANRLRVLHADVFVAWRVVVTLPVVALLFSAVRGWGDVLGVVRRLRRTPALALVLVLDGLLLGVQLWIFGWAPQTGHGLEVALGYLLLPLVMVLVGMGLHRERLTPLRGFAVAAAAVGVLVAVTGAGGIAPVTFVVALGYPLYFVIRRRAGLDTTGAFSLELTVLAPVAVAVLIVEDGLAPLAAAPGLVPGVLLLGLISGSALLLYVAASRALPFGLFGLLTYLEPVLLVSASVALLGERLSPVDGFVYGPIVLALVALGVEPLRRRPALRKEVREPRVTAGRRRGSARARAAAPGTPGARDR